MDDSLNQKAKQILEKIYSANKILVIASKPVDYDSLGTSLAVRWWLMQLRKSEVNLYLFSDIPDHIKHFPDIDLIQQKYTSDVEFDYYDLIITVDGNEFRQFLTNDYKKIIDNVDIEKFVNIDHHLEGKIEEMLGDSCLRKVESCTAKIFYDYFIKESSVELDSQVAQYLYMALIGDTGVFNYGIYPGTFDFAQTLLNSGANHDRAVDLSIPKEMMDFTAWAIQETKYYPEIQSTILVIDEEKKNYLANIYGEDWEKLDLYRYYTNYVMRMVRGYPFSIILSVTSDNLNVRLIYRVKNYGVDLNLMQLLNDNGINVKGHLRAGSGSITGGIQDVEKKYVDMMKNAIQ